MTTVLVLLWMSHSYAETLGERLELGHPLSLDHIGAPAAHELAAPAAGLLSAGGPAAGGRRRVVSRRAVIAALLSAVALLFIIELVAAVAGG